MRLKKISLIVLSTLPCYVYPGSFSLYTETSPAAIANFAAGIGAEGRDAAVGYYNPAALVMLKNIEFVGGGAYVLPTATLSGSSTFTQNISIIGERTLTEDFNSVKGGRNAIIPSFHVAIPGGERVTYGISLAAPLGLTSDWPVDSPLRYQATYSRLVTTELSPQMGGLITNNIALGLGINFQWAQVNYNSILGSPVVPTSPFPTYLDTETSNHGDSFDIGFHAGVLFKSDNNNSRFGVSYTYGTTQQFYGSSALEGRLAGGTPESYARSNYLNSNPIKFPDIINFSVYQQINNKTAMLGSIVYTIWNKYKTINLNNVMLPGNTPTNPSTVNISTTFNYHNTIRASYGMNHDLSDKFQLRWGIGYDQTPTNIEYTDIRIPDANKFAVAGGLHWQANHYLGVDIGYSYLFGLYNAEIKKTLVISEHANDKINASGVINIQLIGAQVVVKV